MSDDCLCFSDDELLGDDNAALDKVRFCDQMSVEIK